MKVLHENGVGLSLEFKVGDMVVYLPNGLVFRCDNKKMWRWMKESGNYVKAPEIGARIALEVALKWASEWS